MGKGDPILPVTDEMPARMRQAMLECQQRETGRKVCRNEECHKG